MYNKNTVEQDSKANYIAQTAARKTQPKNLERLMNT